MMGENNHKSVYALHEDPMDGYPPPYALYDVPQTEKGTEGILRGTNCPRQRLLIPSVRFFVPFFATVPLIITSLAFGMKVAAFSGGRPFVFRAQFFV
jgi:hypothetical protein